ncbi:hypothetical protein RJ55_07669 [Drechmeria coniospora]|nr:hypothetical protein RJ55_07669 [Drechmeria coniospora]
MRATVVLVTLLAKLGLALMIPDQNIQPRLHPRARGLASAGKALSKGFKMVHALAVGSSPGVKQVMTQSDCFGWWDYIKIQCVNDWPQSKKDEWRKQKKEEKERKACEAQNEEEAQESLDNYHREEFYKDLKNGRFSIYHKRWKDCSKPNPDATAEETSQSNSQADSTIENDKPQETAQEIGQPEHTKPAERTCADNKYYYYECRDCPVYTNQYWDFDANKCMTLPNPPRNDSPQDSCLQISKNGLAVNNKDVCNYQSFCDMSTLVHFDYRGFSCKPANGMLNPCKPGEIWMENGGSSICHMPPADGSGRELTLEGIQESHCPNPSQQRVGGRRQMRDPTAGVALCDETFAPSGNPCPEGKAWVVKGGHNYCLVDPGQGRVTFFT